jgi:hypothetical protein
MQIFLSYIVKVTSLKSSLWVLMKINAIIKNQSEFDKLEMNQIHSNLH